MQYVSDMSTQTWGQLFKSRPTIYTLVDWSLPLQWMRHTGLSATPSYYLPLPHSPSMSQLCHVCCNLPETHVQICLSNLQLSHTQQLTDQARTRPPSNNSGLSFGANFTPLHLVSKQSVLFRPFLLHLLRTSPQDRPEKWHCLHLTEHLRVQTKLK